MAICKCSCESNYQDRIYGKGMRVCNQTKNSDKYRCTVCANIITINNFKKDKKDKK